MMRISSLLAVGFTISLLACALPPSADRGQSPEAGQEERARAPKRLTLAVVAEPTGLHQDLSAGLTTAGNRQSFLIVHNYLVVRNEKGARIPQLAEDLISLERGTWRVEPGGTMVTSWKLRPNVKWHDGAPFTADDLLFAFGVYKDPAISIGGTGSGPALKAMASAEVIDPLTFRVHWSSVFVDADWALGLIPIPRHLLEEEFRKDKASIANSPLLGPEFVGLGAYKLLKWDPGVQMEFARFDDYYLGRPTLDTVVLRFMKDPNAMVASILAEGVDALLPQGVDVETAIEVKRRWEGTGHQVTITPAGSLRYIQIQHRPEYSRPRNGLSDRRVRQAFFHATDRQAATEVGTAGTGPIADNWFPPSHELYPQVQSSIPQYPLDLNMATQRLAEAGWVRPDAAGRPDSSGRGGDGVLVNQANGERFEIELRAAQGAGAEKRVAPIAEGWKAAGAAVEINIVPAALSDPEHRVTFPGAGITGNIYDSFFVDLLHSKQAAMPTNRWVGANRSGYANPTVDGILDQLVVTIAPPERLALHRALLAAAMTDVAIIPLYFEVSPTLFLRSVRGIQGVMDNTSTWNFFEWTKDS